MNAAPSKLRPRRGALAAFAEQAASPLNSASHKLRTRRWLNWLVIPSWLLSLLLHAGIIGAVVYLGLIQSHRKPERPDFVIRDIGVLADEFIDGTDDVILNGGQGSEGDRLEQGQPSDAPPQPQVERSTVLGNGPPVALNLPKSKDGPRQLGPGPIAPPMQLPSGRDLRRPGRGNGQGTGTGKGTNNGPGAGTGKGVQFFGITDRSATKIVYVIDASGSMSDHNAFAVARAEILASIQHLTEAQSFQIFFYNDLLHPFVLEGSDRTEFYATDINKNLAANFVRRMQPGLGTRHLLGLEAALRLKPDVLFFLTDAREPELSAEEIDRIKKVCASRTKIHTIEFGIGESLGIETFLKKLSRATNGNSAYRDVLKFDDQSR